MRSLYFTVLCFAVPVLAADTPAESSKSVERETISKGRSLFLKNCAHCHADDATGDEGPDLHHLKQSDTWIEKRIRNGIKSEMPSFDQKFRPEDISSLIKFLRTLS